MHQWFLRYQRKQNNAVSKNESAATRSSQMLLRFVRILGVSIDTRVAAVPRNPRKSRENNLELQFLTAETLNFQKKIQFFFRKLGEN